MQLVWKKATWLPALRELPRAKRNPACQQSGQPTEIRRMCVHLILSRTLFGALKGKQSAALHLRISSPGPNENIFSVVKSISFDTKRRKYKQQLNSTGRKLQYGVVLT